MNRVQRYIGDIGIPEAGFIIIGASSDCVVTFETGPISIDQLAETY